MNKRNYQRELDEIINKLRTTGERPVLFLHCCCAPCSSYVLEYLSEYFQMVLYFYNPNITDAAEYEKRKAELMRLVREGGYPGGIDILDEDFDSSLFFQMTRGLEEEPECGRRCFICYEMRLQKTAQIAVGKGADYFCTTLSISPHKRAD